MKVKLPILNGGAKHECMYQPIVSGPGWPTELMGVTLRAFRPGTLLVNWKEGISVHYLKE